MGFTGDVFAARVAIGLAMPSPSSLSKSGALIAGFAKGMYNRLNASGQQAAKARLSNAEANLNETKSKIEAFDSAIGARIQASAKKSIDQTRKITGGSFAESGREMSNFRKGISKQAPEIEVKLFKNVGEHMTAAQKYEEMVKNFFEMNEKERESVMNLLKDRELASKARLDEAKAARDGTEAKEREYKAAKYLHGQRKKERGEFLKYARDRKNVQGTIDKERHDLLQQEKEDKMELVDATNEYNDSLAKSEEVSRRLEQISQQMVYTIKTEFVSGLREAVSALTAFYYKLNQNTQELILFERELMNANSVFGLTRSEMFETGNVVTEFGQKFGMEMQNGAQGLYQLASAGVTANEALSILPETLKLSMAVQGDHNTISKLTAQTLFGFDMEMSQAGEVTDKFAHAIQKSLIEYEDLSSAVKFALPFFTTTGQSIDQLLGALAVLTNRALEAGIAGRGLRQGLAELAESIGDNTARFREFGVEVVDSQGNMLQLTEIASNFAAVLEAGVINDTELLTSLIEDLNVRGATAFVHLVQASDDFTAAVESSASSGGELDEMVRIQNESLGAQVQILKNNVQAIFLMRDASYEGTEFMNAFHEALVNAVQSLKDLLVEGEEGSMKLTLLGQQIQDLAVRGIGVMAELLAEIIPLVKKFTEAGFLNLKLLEVYVIPIKIVLDILTFLGPELTRLIVSFHLMNKVLPILAVAQGVMNMAVAIAIGLGKIQIYDDTTRIGINYMLWEQITALNIQERIGNRLKAIRNFLTWENTKLQLKAIGRAAIRLLQKIMFSVIQPIVNALFSVENFLLATQNIIVSASIILWGIFWIVVTGGIILLVAGLAIIIAQLWKMFDATERIKLTFAHLFGMLKAGFMWYVDMWVNMGKYIYEFLEGPLELLILRMAHFFKMVMYYKDEIADLFGGVVQEVAGALGSIVGRAEGGRVYAMGRAGGGQIGRGSPYMVGEKGPELFIPGQSGQVVANKALNSSATNALLQKGIGSSMGNPVPVVLTGGEIGHIAVKKMDTAKTAMGKVKQSLDRLF